MKIILPIILFFALSIPAYAYDGAEVLGEVNTYRVSKSLKPLETSRKTCEIASIRATEIKKKWAHNIKGRFSGYNKLGENLARNFDSAEAIVVAWDKSPSHRAVMTENYKQGCIKCVGTYCAFILIK